MYDRRVIRGNTYAAQVVTQSAQRESSRLRQEHERRLRLEALRRRQVWKSCAFSRDREKILRQLYLMQNVID